MGDTLPSCIWLACCLVLCVCGSVESTAAGTQDNGCPEGFLLYASSCYLLISDPLTNGIDSRSTCADVYPGSHLAFIESQAEQTYITELAKEWGRTDDYWFGLTFTTDPDHPEWLDGRPLGEFSAWDRYGAFNEDYPCVRMQRANDYLWSDRKCTGYEFGCVCEIEITDEPTTPTTPTTPTPTPTTTEDPTTLTLTPTAIAPLPQTQYAVYKASQPNMAAPSDDSHLIQSISGVSLFRCANHCLGHNNCASFNYKSAEGKDKLDSFCELYSVAFPDEELTEKQGNRYYGV